MKLASGLLAATLAMPILLASTNEVEQKYLAFGMGVTKCTEANENFEKKEFQFVLKVWLTGYMTAVNSVLREHPIGLSNADIDGAIEDIRSYCASPSNEHYSIGEAADVYWRGRVQEMSVKLTQ